MTPSDGPDAHNEEPEVEPPPPLTTPGGNGAKEPAAEFELLLGNRHLLAIFAVILVALGAFFGAGYAVGRWGPKPASKPAQAPASPAPQDPHRVPTQIEFVRIRPGEFVMGFRRGRDDSLFEELKLNLSSGWGGEEDAFFSEFKKEMTRDCPARRVRIARAFELGKYEVSVGQWEAVMGDERNHQEWSDYPVENVSWEDVQEFLKQLNDRRDGYRYRLPTEAEWEYAARAGTSGEATDEMYRDAWDNLPGDRGMSVKRPVDLGDPNAWGLHNMLGNVAEWVADWYGSRFYRVARYADPRGPRHGRRRVVRGGSYYDVSFTAFVWGRAAELPTENSSSLGFRCAREKTE